MDIPGSPGLAARVGRGLWAEPGADYVTVWTSSFTVSQCSLVSPVQGCLLPTRSGAGAWS